MLTITDSRPAQWGSHHESVRTCRTMYTGELAIAPGFDAAAKHGRTRRPVGRPGRLAGTSSWASPGPVGLAARGATATVVPAQTLWAGCAATLPRRECVADVAGGGCLAALVRA